MFTALFVLAFLYFIAAFCCFVGERLNAYKLARTVDLTELFTAVDKIMDKPIYRSVGCAAVDYSQFTCEQLRNLCNDKGIKWRNIHGKNRHLKKAEMVSLLASA